MGLMKFLARKGAIGGTARLIAKQYNRYRRIHGNKDEMPDYAIYRLIIMDRFKALPNESQEQHLKDKAPKFSGLSELVREILGVEAGYYENTFENQRMFNEIIHEELLKKGVKESDL